MPKENKTYTIKNLSEKQIKIIEKALEMYARIGLLQFDNVIDSLFNWGNNKNFSSAYTENRQDIEYHCKEIRNLIVSKDNELSKYDKFGNWSLGIGNDKTSLDAKIAYEIKYDISDMFGDDKGRLTLSDETPIIIKKENPREEKLKQVIKKIKKDTKK